MTTKNENQEVTLELSLDTAIQLKDDELKTITGGAGTNPYVGYGSQPYDPNDCRAPV